MQEREKSIAFEIPVLIESPLTRTTRTVLSWPLRLPGTDVGQTSPEVLVPVTKYTGHASPRARDLFKSRNRKHSILTVLIFPWISFCKSLISFTLFPLSQSFLQRKRSWSYLKHENQIACNTCSPVQGGFSGIKIILEQPDKSNFLTGRNSSHKV